jgi:hypothetical protein
MGIFWKLLAPKGAKRARRTVRRAAHPVRTASWAVSPEPVKRARRAAYRAANPGDALECKIENEIIRGPGAAGGGAEKREAAELTPAQRLEAGCGLGAAEQAAFSRSWLPAPVPGSQSPIGHLAGPRSFWE